MFGFFNRDCLSENGLPSLPDHSVHIFILDLPFGITQNKWDSIIPITELWKQLLRVGNTDAMYIFFAKQPFTTLIMNSQPDLFSHELIWMKEKGTCPMNANRFPLPVHENILVFAKGKVRYYPQKMNGDPYAKKVYASLQGTNYRGFTKEVLNCKNEGYRFPVSVLFYPRDFANCGIHPTQKPVALLEYLLQTYSVKHDVVLDPTAGSASTLVACVNTNRNYIGYELDSAMFMLASNRLNTVLQRGQDTFTKPKVVNPNQKTLDKMWKKNDLFTN